MDYADLLKDTRWTRKRNIIFKRDDRKCTVCGEKKNLEVHHTFYYSDYPDPWKYPDDSLLTVCKICHHEWHLHNENIIIDPPSKKRIRVLKIKVNRGIKSKKKHRKKQISLGELQVINGLRIKERKARN